MKNNETAGTKVAESNRQLMQREKLKKLLGLSKLSPEEGWEEELKKQPVYSTGVSYSGGR
jgi:hypothetical protein